MRSTPLPLLSLLFLTLTLVSAAPPPERPNDEITDPYHQTAQRGSTISLYCSNFFRPSPGFELGRFDTAQGLDVANRAQTEIVAEIVKAKATGGPDAAIAQPNFQWCSWHGRRPMCLRVNHQLDKNFTWWELSQAIRAIVDFMWQADFRTTKLISIYEATKGEVATAEMVWRAG